jgi:hypothetical protein
MGQLVILLSLESDQRHLAEIFSLQYQETQALVEMIMALPVWEVWVDLPLILVEMQVQQVDPIPVSVAKQDVHRGKPVVMVGRVWVEQDIHQQVNQEKTARSSSTAKRALNLSLISNASHTLWHRFQVK